jgi:hypothetical protein
MSNPESRRFPVTVTQLPVVRCQTCRRTVACQSGTASEALTGHYRRAHPRRTRRSPSPRHIGWSTTPCWRTCPRPSPKPSRRSAPSPSTSTTNSPNSTPPATLVGGAWLQRREPSPRPAAAGPQWHRERWPRQLHSPAVLGDLALDLPVWLRITSACCREGDSCRCLVAACGRAAPCPVAARLVLVAGGMGLMWRARGRVLRLPW